MKVAIIGSRTLTVRQETLLRHVPETVTAIISGGADGVDQSAAEFARRQNLPLVEHLPDYPRFKRAAPLKRNDRIIDDADLVLIFWDGKSKGTKYVFEQCRKLRKSHKIFCLTP